jgi:hypothetical protein
MSYVTITIEGGLIPDDLLQAIADEQSYWAAFKQLEQEKIPGKSQAGSLCHQEQIGGSKRAEEDDRRSLMLEVSYHSQWHRLPACDWSLYINQAAAA